MGSSFYACKQSHLYTQTIPPVYSQKLASKGGKAKLMTRGNMLRNSCHHNTLDLLLNVLSFGSLVVFFFSFYLVTHISFEAWSVARMLHVHYCFWHIIS